MAKRPRNPNQLAELIVDIATGEADDPESEAKRDPNRRGRAGGLKGGTSIYAESKLIVFYLVGGRDGSFARLFMEDVASRVASRVQITTDGQRAYVEAVEGAFGMHVGLRDAYKALRHPCQRGNTL